MWVGEETRRNLPIELDFTHEAQNCAEAAKNLKCFSWVKVGVNASYAIFLLNMIHNIYNKFGTKIA